MIVEFLLRHTFVRRACSLGLLALLCAVAIVLVPLALLSDGLSIVTGRGTGRGGGGRGRASRFAAFACAYLAAEVAGLCGALCLRRTDQEAHFALLTRLLSLLFRTSRRAFRLRVLAPEQGLELPDGPLLVFSRHAGPGDSFLLVYALLKVACRRPRVVLKRVLTLDPLIDLVLGRTRNCFVGRGASARAEAARHIGELSASLGSDEALLLFPEGGNFTRARRERLISRLRRLRRWRVLPTATAFRIICSRRSLPACSAPSTPRRRTPRSCSSPTPGSTASSPSPTPGARSRSIDPCNWPGGRFPSHRSRPTSRRG